MEFKADALLLRTADYGENDRMATLLTAERGKVSACFKGVRRAGAKLRFAAQPFCFAEYVFASRAGRNTVTSASLYDGFPAVCEDVGRFYAAAAVTEACDRLALEGMQAGELLVAAVTALKELCKDEPLALVRFLLSALSYAGYPPEAGVCPVCGKIPSGRMRFSFADGAFFCGGCTEEGVPASESTYLAVRAAQEGGAFPADGAVRALRLLGAYFARQVGVGLSALTEYLHLAAMSAE